MTYTEIAGTDTLSATRAVLNANFKDAGNLNTASVAATFTVWADDAAGSPKDLYLVTTAAATIVANLPTVASGDAAAGRVVTIMKIDSGVGAVSIDPSGSETINGSATAISLSGQYEYRTLVHDGATGWTEISRQPPASLAYFGAYGPAANQALTGGYDIVVLDTQTQASPAASWSFASGRVTWESTTPATLHVVYRSLIAQVGGAGIIGYVRLHKNGTLVPGSEMRAHVGGNTFDGIGSSAFVDVVENDVLDVRARSSGTTDFALGDFTHLTIVQVS
tara:strand:- start:4 stop:837 length:834 start_codon:yes stop_codon:yes gene_type:complete